MKRLLFFAGLLVLLAFIFAIPSKSFATSWAYPFVVWDGFIYIVSEEYVGETGREIGKVTSFSDMEQYGGNFSNSYEKGTRYYSIEGINPEVAIAVQEENGQYRKAVREGKYAYSRSGINLAGWIIGYFIVFVAVGLSYECIKKRVR